MEHFIVPQWINVVKLLHGARLETGHQQIHAELEKHQWLDYKLEDLSLALTDHKNDLRPIY